MNSVAIVVLNWNRMGDTRRCLASLKRQSFANFTIVLVDNGSTEKGTAKNLDNLETVYGKKLHVIRNLSNKGFAGGVNIGIKYALDNNFSFVALFNNDAKAEPSWLTQLVSASERHNSAITTGLLLNADGRKIDSTGDWYSTWGLPFPRGRGLERSTANKSGFVFGASGGASLYRTGMFREVGLFDESFFAYYEDVDISFRAQLKGFKVYYANDAIAFHAQGASSSHLPGFAVYQTFKNLPMLFTKNVPLSLWIVILPRFFIAYHLMFLKALIKRNRLQAIRGWFIGGLLSVCKLPNRWTIQAHRTVSASYIADLLWHDLPPDQTGIRRIFRKSTFRD